MEIDSEVVLNKNEAIAKQTLSETKHPQKPVKQMTLENMLKFPSVTRKRKNTAAGQQSMQCFELSEQEREEEYGISKKVAHMAVTNTLKDATESHPRDSLWTVHNAYAYSCSSSDSLISSSHVRPLASQIRIEKSLFEFLATHSAASLVIYSPSGGGKDVGIQMATRPWIASGMLTVVCLNPLNVSMYFSSFVETGSNATELPNVPKSKMTSLLLQLKSNAEQNCRLRTRNMASSSYSCSSASFDTNKSVATTIDPTTHSILFWIRDADHFWWKKSMDVADVIKHWNKSNESKNSVNNKNNNNNNTFTVQSKLLFSVSDEMWANSMSLSGPQVTWTGLQSVDLEWLYSHKGFEWSANRLRSHSPLIRPFLLDLQMQSLLGSRNSKANLPFKSKSPLSLNLPVKDNEAAKLLLQSLNDSSDFTNQLLKISLSGQLDRSDRLASFLVHNFWTHSALVHADISQWSGTTTTTTATTPSTSPATNTFLNQCVVIGESFLVLDRTKFQQSTNCGSWGMLMNACANECVIQGVHLTTELARKRGMLILPDVVKKTALKYPEIQHYQPYADVHRLANRATSLVADYYSNSLFTQVQVLRHVRHLYRETSQWDYVKSNLLLEERAAAPGADVVSVSASNYAKPPETRNSSSGSSSSSRLKKQGSVFTATTTSESEEAGCFKALLQVTQ